jgi:hypothetical protein
MFGHAVLCCVVCVPATDSEVHHYVLGLENHKFDFSIMSDLLFWLNLRTVVVRGIVPVNYGVSQWLFAGMFVSVIFLMLVDVSRVMLSGIEAFMGFGGVSIMVAVVALSIYLTMVLSKGAAIWLSQQQHVNMLHQEKWLVRSKLLLGGASATKQGNVRQNDRIYRFLKQMQDDIANLDPAPTILGLALKPTALRVLQV